MKLLQKELTEKIINAFYHVYNELGYGFLEKVYQNALYIELTNKGLKVATNQKTTVYYKSVNVGDYYADMIVNDLVILELKAAEQLVKENEWQLLNYLRSTNIQVGLLLNFGKKPGFRRMVYENHKKKMTLPVQKTWGQVV